MKLHQALIVATLSLSVLVGDSHAQDSDGRMFGNGRFLKKMRDDIFGPKPKTPTPSYQSRKPAPSRNPLSLAVKGKGKVPTPALPTDGERPSAIDAQSTYQYKATQTRPKQSLAVSSKTAQYKKPTSTNRTSQSRPAAKGTTISPKAMESVTRSGKKQTLAFGMLLETRGDNLVVTNLDPAGNATKAGVRKGDLILGAGGLELGSMLEFNEITDVLRSGDQLEFVVARSGKKDKKLILFGEAPDMTSREVVESNSTSSRNAVGTGTARRSSNLNEYQIAPSNNSMHSVIESQETQFVPKQTYQPRKPVNTSGRRNTDQQIEALEAASVRGETILNIPN